MKTLGAQWVRHFCSVTPVVKLDGPRRFNKTGPCLISAAVVEVEGAGSGSPCLGCCMAVYSTNAAKSLHARRVETLVQERCVLLSPDSFYWMNVHGFHKQHMVEAHFQPKI